MNDESIFSQPFDDKMMQALMAPDEKVWFKYRLGEESPSFGEILGLPGMRTGRFTRAREEREAGMNMLMGKVIGESAKLSGAPSTFGEAQQQNPTAFGLSGIQPPLQQQQMLGPPAPGQAEMPSLQVPNMSAPLARPQAAAYMGALGQVPAAVAKRPTAPTDLAKQAVLGKAVEEGDWAEVRRIAGTLETQKAEKDDLGKFTEMLLRAGIDPTGQQGQALYKSYAEKTATHPKAAQQQVSVNAFLPASEEAQRDFMKSTRTTYDQLKQAPVLLKNIEAAKALVPQAKGFMGTGGETMLEAAKFLNNRLGTNINVAGIKGAEELRSRIFFNIMDNLKKMDAQPSQMQQMIMQDALGKLGTDPNALPAVLDAYAEVIRGKITIHNQEVVGAVARGVKFPYDPTIKVPKKIKTDADYQQLPSGSEYLDPEGNTRIKK